MNNKLASLSLAAGVALGGCAGIADRAGDRTSSFNDHIRCSEGVRRRIESLKAYIPLLTGNIDWQVAHDVGVKSGFDCEGNSPEKMQADFEGILKTMIALIDEQDLYCPYGQQALRIRGYANVMAGEIFLNGAFSGCDLATVVFHESAHVYESRDADFPIYFRPNHHKQRDYVYFMGKVVSKICKDAEKAAALQPPQPTWDRLWHEPPNGIDDLIEKAEALMRKSSPVYIQNGDDVERLPPP